VFFISQAEISLLDEVNRISDIVDNQRSRGAKIARFRSFDLKPDQCVMLYQNDSYLYLTEDRELRPHHNPCRVTSATDRHASLWSITEKHMEDFLLTM
jgi:hypothetical protein